MNKKTTVDNLAKEIEKSLADFAGVTEEACEKGVIETAQDAVKALRAAHPSENAWPNYNKGWTVRTEKSRTFKSGILSVVWNKEHYRLTHLLEKGHALRHGGRKVGETRPFEHIAPVDREAEENLVKNIRKRVENG